MDSIAIEIDIGIVFKAPERDFWFLQNKNDSSDSSFSWSELVDEIHQAPPGELTHVIKRTTDGITDCHYEFDVSFDGTTKVVEVVSFQDAADCHITEEDYNRICAEIELNPVKV